MADLPLLGGGGRQELIGATLASSVLTTVTAGANAYGSYAELSASTSFEYNSIILYMVSPSLRASVLKIAIGGSGSEVDIATDICTSTPTSRRQIVSIPMPLKIPAGSRVSVAMARATGTTGTYEVAIMGIQGGVLYPVGFQRATGYGITAAAANGTTVTAAGSAHTKGSYAQLTSSTTYPIRLLQPMAAGEETSTSLFAFDVAVGAAASEVDVISNALTYSYASTGEIAVQGALMLPCSIPSGTRLSARTQASNASDFLRFSVIGYS